MYRSILVVTEGTPLSKKAVKAALRMAHNFDAKVTALNVQPPYQPPIAGEVPAAFLHNPAEYDQIAREASAKILADVAAMAAKLEVPTTTVTVFDHSIYKAIIRTAKTRRCDLIVMASHGRRGIRGILLGSETQKVLTHCQIPVLVHR